MKRPSTLAELRRTDFHSRSVRDEIRANLIRRLRAGDKLFPGVHGFDDTVVPALVNALLARHDIILLGLRGQAKTRLLRSLAGLLDETIAVVDGCEINDDPLSPSCVPCRRRLAEVGDDLPIRWLEREERYQEKLATPDVTIADLIGDVDPIKAATRRLNLADPEVVHYGIVPRTNRGIFALNELPDLAPRIQVGLLNILEERDLQIRGFPIRIPLDLLLVFSANPEDYTSRGNIITPLKDRIAAQILTHYPTSLAVARRITAQEAWTERDSGVDVVIPEAVADLLEGITFEARESDLVDHSSGVSARMSIAMLETLIANLERRGLATGAGRESPRICDLWSLLPSITGKVEMVYEGEQQGPEIVGKKIVGGAVKNLFDAHFPAPPRPRKRTAEEPHRFGRGDEDEPQADDPWTPITAWFDGENRVEVSDDTTLADHLAALDSVPGLAEMASSHLPTTTDADRAFAMELILEGLHQHRRLVREDLDSTISYAQALRFGLLDR